MDFDLTITLGNVLTLGGVCVAGIGAYFYQKFRVEKASDTANAALLKANALEAEMNTFKLEVAKTYATNSAIKEVEERVVAAIERLGDRLDRLFERAPTRRGSGN